jgi:hypothetical protein
MDSILKEKLMTLTDAFSRYLQVTPVTPEIFGMLVGTITKELCDFEDFHKGYQNALTKDITRNDIMPLQEELLDILRNPRNTNQFSGKIFAIKRCREITKMSLKEAKDYVEDLMILNGL